MKTDLLPTPLQENGRIIGSIEGAGNGPVVVVFGGIHGNEPSGIEAFQNVLKILEEKKIKTRGFLVGIRGNLTALQKNVRFIDEDLNRIWFPSILDRIRSTPAGQLESSERKEIKQILHLLDTLLPDPGNAPAIMVDLHSFSAEGNIFALSAPRDSHINLLDNLHVPMVFGIEDTLQGTALRHYQDSGHIAFALEGGQHHNELTVVNKTTAILLLLAECGFIDRQQVPRIEEYESHLLSQTRNLPSRVELVYQHMIEEGDNFHMRPGFRNFQPVKKGEWLASDREGKIFAECDGYILMPLYQKQGNDGFFIVREEDGG